MIVDTSAIVAIVKAEPGWEAIASMLVEQPGSRMSAATYVELGVVLDRSDNPAAVRRGERLLRESGIEITAVTPEQAQIARAAHRDFGRGSGHRAGLNFGDCFAYALAVDADEPLLFVGDGFTHTDVRPALS